MTDESTSGARLDALGLRRFLERAWSAGEAELASGRAATPVCVWGTHGIGKTSIVEDLARERGLALAYAAPAQFEEMGDLHGLPVLTERADGTRETRFAAPSWVPREPGPGVLLLDDLNRADDRILRGLMQLLQRGELVSWSLPRGWQIVATANPESGDYSVTPMDDAMRTRMLHVTLGFDAKAWARWASRAGVDPRGIDFVLTYPESVTGRRTTPRSLTQFFSLIAPIPDLEAELELVSAFGTSVLDEATVASFVAFVSDGLPVLLTPEEILESDDARALERRVRALARDGATLRLDRLGTVCTRLYLALTRPGYVPRTRHAENLVRFLLHADLPNDLRLCLHRDLVAEGGEKVAAMMRDPRLAELALAGV